MKKSAKVLTVLATAVAMCFAAIACGEGQTPIDPEVPVLYTVVYELNGGSGTAPTESEKAAGAKFTVASADGLTKAEFTFDGWSDGKTVYAAGAEYTMPASNVTFTAQWKADEQQEPEDPEDPEGPEDPKDPEEPDEPQKQPYSVTYDLDGAIMFDENDNVVPAVAPTVEDQYVGDTFTLALALNFGKDGKAFGGWSDGNAVYPMGAEYTMPDNDVTITALWNDPLTIDDIAYNWSSANGDALYVSDDGSAILDGECFIEIDIDAMIAYSSYYIVNDNNNEEYIERLWFVYGSPEMLMFTEIGEDEGGNDFAAVINNITFDAKIQNSAEVSDFAGKWKRTSNNQPWLVAEDGVKYGLTLAEANDAYIIGDKIVLSYQSFGYPYVYILEKDGDALVGYFYQNERGAVEVTFEVGTFVTLTVDGVLNQVILSAGSKPDADKIIAPTAPEGERFAGWVIAGTETPFDVNAAIDSDTAIESTFEQVSTETVKTYTGSVSINGSTYTSITIDIETGEVTINGTVYETSKSEQGYCMTDGAPFGEIIWFVISEDGTTMSLHDDWNGPDEKYGELTLEA